MTDAYIDYDEVGEYGNHFTSEAKKLLGASPLVDVAALIKRLSGDTKAVATALEGAGSKRGKRRASSGEVKTTAAMAGKVLDQFWSFLGSIDGVDVAAFFEGGKKGATAKLKPGDVRSKALRALRGFTAHTKLPQGDAWKKRLTDAEAELGAALGGKGDAHGGSISQTAELVAARESFLVSYNGVAKPIVRGLLTSLGREGEMALFFKDLQVNEGARKRKKAGDGAQPVAPAAPK
jgi:hypothetical protein